MCRVRSRRHAGQAVHQLLKVSRSVSEHAPLTGGHSSKSECFHKGLQVADLLATRRILPCAEYIDRCM